MKITLTILSIFLGSLMGFAQTGLTGKVIEERTGDAVIYASVALYKNDVLITGVETDFDGVYSFLNIDPGTYDVEVSYVGFPTKRAERVVIMADKSNSLNFSIKNSNIDCEHFEVIYCPIPMIRQDDFNKGRTFLSSEIRRFASSTNN